MAMQESAGVYRRPVFPSAVDWSQDNLLAVATGASAVIFSPADLAGPRAFVAEEDPDWEAADAEAVPRNADSNIHYRLTHMRRNFGAISQQRPAVRSVSWSPPGCTATGGCVLATVTDDHKVRLYAPTSAFAGQWSEVADLSAALRDHLQADNWKAAQPEQADGDDAGTLRLRGGGTSRLPQAAPRAGSRVEIMNDEDGLRDSWYSGVITQIKHKYALVKYDHLLATEAPPTALQEWIKLPGAAVEDAAKLNKAYPSKPDASDVLRPEPPQEFVEKGVPRQVGDAVDAWTDDGWWECEVLSANPQKRTAVVQLPDTSVEVPWDQLRTRMRWDGSAWTLVHESMNAAGKRTAGAAGKAGSSKGKQAISAAGESALDDEPSRDLSDDEDMAMVEADLDSDDGDFPLSRPAQQAKRSTASAGPSSSAGPSTAGKRGGKASSTGARRKSSAADKAAKAEGKGKDAKGKRARAAEANGAAGSASKRRKADGEPSQPDAPAYVVPEDFSAADFPKVDSSSADKLKMSIRIAFMQRVADLREQIPEEERHTYAMGDADDPADRALMERADAEMRAAYGALLAEHGLDAEAQAKRGRAYVRQYILETIKKPTPHPPSVVVPYEVPEGFGADQLPGVDLTSPATCRSTVPAAFLTRFLELRRQLPAAQLPHYQQKGEHMYGADAQLVEQVRAELMAVHGAVLAGHGYDSKWLLSHGRGRLRHSWDPVADQAAEKVRTRAKAEQQDNAQPGPLAPPAPGSDQAAAASGSAQLPRKRTRRDAPVGKAGAAGTAQATAKAGKQRQASSSSAQKQKPAGRGPKQGEDESEDGDTVESRSDQDHESAEEEAGSEDDDFVSVSSKGKGAGSNAAGASGKAKKAKGRSKEGGAAEKKQHRPTKPEPYKVPEGFDASVFQPLDFSSTKALTKTLQDSFLARWLDLRSEVPAAELPKYQKGQHLSGPDAALAERVIAEMVAAFHEDLQRVGLDEKFVRTEGKRAIRVNVIQTNTKPSKQPAEPKAVDGGLVVVQKRRRASAASHSAVADECAHEGGSDESDDDFQPQLAIQPAAPAPTSARPIKRQFTLPPTNQMGLYARSKTGLPQIPDPQYERRLALTAALQVSWSPTWSMAQPDGSLASFVLLAVGSKAGQIWLWRYRLPAYSLAAASPVSAADFVLLGGVQASSSWVSALAWAPAVLGSPASANAGPTSTPQAAPGEGVLLLSAGFADGSVRLFGQRTGCLASAPAAQTASSRAAAGTGTVPRANGAAVVSSGGSLESLVSGFAQSAAARAGSAAGQANGASSAAAGGTDAGSQAAPLLQLLGVAVQPDLRPVASLSMHHQSSAAASGSGSSVLMLAVGKPTGLVEVWTSGRLPTSPAPSLEALQAAISQGQVSAVRGGHSTAHVTGVSWRALDAAAEADAPDGALLLSTGVDGTAKSWRVHGGQVTPYPAPERVGQTRGSCVRPDAAFGGALSSTGSCAAVLFDIPGLEHIKQQSNWAKLHKGHLDIIRLQAGSDPPQLAAVAKAAAAALLQRASTPHLLWDLVQLLRSQAPQPQAVPNAPAAPQPTEGSGPAGRHASASAQAAEGSGVAGEADTAGAEGDAAEAEPAEPAEAEERSAADSAAENVAATQAEAAKAVCQSELVQAVLEILEQPFLESLAAHNSDQPASHAAPANASRAAAKQASRGNSKRKAAQDPSETSGVHSDSSTGPGFPACIPMPAWRGLQAATAIRHLLDPNKTVVRRGDGRGALHAAAGSAVQPGLPSSAAAPAVGQGGGSNGQAGNGVLAEWQDALQRNELQLLQRHVVANLAAATGDAAPADGSLAHLSLLLMADWVTAHASWPALHQELPPLAAATYAHYQESPPAAGLGTLPSREVWAGKTVGLGSTDLDLPRTAAIDLGGCTIPLPRCGATLRICDTPQAWRCYACLRHYSQAVRPEPDSGCCLLRCLFCGVRLGRPGPSTVLSAPVVR